MRLSNIIIGFLLAVVLAYLHDVSVAATGPDGHPQNFVNWDVFRRSAETAGKWTVEQVEQLVDQIHGRG